MGLFDRLTGAGSDKPARGSRACPICDELLTKDRSSTHWMDHVVEIESGEAAGNYTWTCSCGPANMAWPSDSGAWAGLKIHMSERHGFPPL